MPLRACLVFRADPASLVPLREELFASTYLACLLDADGRVHDWLELVCRTPYMVETNLAFRDATNSHVNMELKRRLGFDKTVNPESVLALPEGQVPALFVDPASKAIRILETAGEGPWELCTDDEVLTAAGLARYSTSEFQYLVSPGTESHRFLPVSGAAPAGRDTVSIEDIDPSARSWILLTVGGTVSLRRFTPLSFGTYCDLLVGNKPPKVVHEKQELELFSGPPWNPEAGAAALATGRLLVGHTGIGGKVTETLHLKLQAFTEALLAVRRAIAATQRPLLTLTEGDFRVGISRIGPNMPAYWNATVTLRPPADAVELPTEGDHHYFIPNAVAPSIYTAPAASATARGSANIRLRKVTATPSGAIVFEGTLSTQERLKAGNLDLVLIKLNLGGTPLSIATHLESEKALAKSEFRFTSNPVKVDDHVKTRIATFEGAWVEGASFEVLPLLSSPSDLFSLAILAIRGLLVAADFPLPVAVDEIMSLAHETTSDSGKLVEQIARLFAADERWAKSLGPQRLTDETLTPAAALDLVPRVLWYDILAWIIRMIPGAHPESYSADFAQAPLGRIETVLDGPLRESRRLLACTRSLLIVDWQMNREVGSAIRDVLKEVSR